MMIYYLIIIRAALLFVDFMDRIANIAPFTSLQDYEKDRDALYEFFVDCGPFATVPEYLDRKYGQDFWRKQFIPQASSTSHDNNDYDDETYLALVAEIENTSYQVSVAFVDYCRSFNRLYREVATIIKLGIPELLRVCLPQRLDAMDILFLAIHCPVEMFKWILCNWPQIDYDTSNITSLLTSYYEEPYERKDRDCDSYQEWMSTNWDVFDSFGYWPDVYAYDYYNQREMTEDYVDNLMFGIRPETKNVYQAVLHGLSMHQYLIDVLRSGTKTEEICRLYFPHVAHLMKITDFAGINYSIDSIYFCLTQKAWSEADIKKLQKLYTDDMDFNGLLALHFAGYDPLTIYNNEEHAGNNTLFISMLEDGLYDHLLFENLGIKDTRLIKKIKKHNRDTETYYGLVDAIEKTTDIRFRKLLAAQDLRPVLSRRLAMSYWHLIPREIKKVYLTLELIRNYSNSIYNILPSELSMAIFTFAYATV